MTTKADDFIKSLEAAYAKAESTGEGDPVYIGLARALQPAYVRWIEEHADKGECANRVTQALICTVAWMMLTHVGYVDKSREKAIATMFDALGGEIAHLVAEYDRATEVQGFEVVDAFEEEAEAKRKARMDAYLRNSLPAGRA